MRVVNIKELKARLSAYVREVVRGETFLVTDRDRVVARLAPPPTERDIEKPISHDDIIARLVARGCRPPLRERRPTDYQRWPGPKPDVTTQEIDAALAWTREDRV